MTHTARMGGLIAIGLLGLGGQFALAQAEKPAASSGTAQPILFPKVHGKSLAGKERTLPKGLVGKKNLVILAFTRDQQKDVDLWLTLARRLAGETKGLSWLEVPVFGDINFILKGIIETAMRAGMPDHEENQIIPVYKQKEWIKKTLSIPNEESTWIVVVEKGGRVLWQSPGPFSEAKEKALERLLVGPEKDLKVQVAPR
jgi:hypothetical protein